MAVSNTEPANTGSSANSGLACSNTPSKGDGSVGWIRAAQAFPQSNGDATGETHHLRIAG